MMVPKQKMPMMFDFADLDFSTRFLVDFHDEIQYRIIVFKRVVAPRRFSRVLFIGGCRSYQAPPPQALPPHWGVSSIIPQ
jgi:hypothetical protein